ncbi:MAG: response regulator transcription factor [Rectinema sp.]
MEKVVIVDDDEKMSALLVRYLGEFGFEVVSMSRPSEALALLGQSRFDIAILDVMLPEMDGFELLKKIREIDGLPIIMLTARGELPDRVLGLELGSDDYIQKPFEPRELVARIRAILRRRKANGDVVSDSSVIKVAGIVLNRATFSVTVDGVPIELTTSEFQLLDIFLSSPRIVFPREVLMDKLRGSSIGAFDRSIDVLVSRLRTQLQDDSRNPRFIKTIHGIGYVFMAE